MEEPPRGGHSSPAPSPRPTKADAAAAVPRSFFDPEESKAPAIPPCRGPNPITLSLEPPDDGDGADALAEATAQEAAAGHVRPSVALPPPKRNRRARPVNPYTAKPNSAASSAAAEDAIERALFGASGDHDLAIPSFPPVEDFDLDYADGDDEDGDGDDEASRAVRGRAPDFRGGQGVR